jgi:hypothetical protein
MTAAITRRPRSRQPDEGEPTAAESLKQKLMSYVVRGDHPSADTLRRQLQSARMNRTVQVHEARVSQQPQDSVAIWADENGVIESIKLTATREAREYFDRKRVVNQKAGDARLKRPPA